MASQGLMPTYDPKQVVIIFGGVPIMGYAEDSFVECAPAEEGFSRKVGADGEVVRSKSNNNCYDVTVTLLQTSLSNGVLSAANIADRATGKGLLPLSITEIASGSEHFFPQAWVEKPTWSRGKEAGEQAWTFHTGQAAVAATNGIVG